jgi:hypothetical protein
MDAFTFGRLDDVSLVMGGLAVGRWRGARHYLPGGRCPAPRLSQKEQIMAFAACVVNSAGPAVDGGIAGITPDPQINIQLTDLAGSFPGGTWFYAADVGKMAILAVAIAAMTAQRTVGVSFIPPNAGNNPFTEIYGMYLSQ